MDEENNALSYLFWGGVIVFIIWAFIFNNKPDTEYIREEFDNGKAIEMEVDDSITRDNWECTGDCSGHDAGYEWAEEKGITDPSDCGGKSESFIEGCEAYANENY
ncbi:hypothetical protein A2397_02030 [Candidatus Amesbacteria bacterium RIFOXYB1_FULL_44_23]|uniref:Uncharacterized protein n=1 Tax=Candidatus Amesbacteria bacterium RIFOXYB1_FULL_44_23 TaxID=1797263 RepID=A0A1F4ZVH2_9BACT|nr:MAG: hypothetical protein A2397_02030 [Candidatus Amesbacteria bacterium RIFOXYB1_FULL_44_23]